MMVMRDRMFEDNSDIRPWVRIGEVLDGALDKMLGPEPLSEDEERRSRDDEQPFGTGQA